MVPRHSRIQTGALWSGFIFSCSLLTFGARLQGACESQLPASTLFAMVTDDWKLAASQWQISSWGRFFSSDAWDPLQAAMRAEGAASMWNIESWVGVDWATLREFEGPAAIAYVVVEKRGGWVLLLDAARNQALTESCLEKIRRSFVDRNWKSTISNIGGQQIQQFTPPGGAEDDSRTVWICHTTANLLISDSVDAIRSVLAADVAAKSLEKTKLYGDTVSNTGAPASARWFCRPLELWSALDTVPKNRRVGQRDLLAALRKQGFRGLKSIGGSIRFGTAGELELEGAVIALRPFKAAMQVLDLHPGPVAKPPEWVATSAIDSYYSLNWDFQTGMSAIGLLYSEIEDPEVPTAYEDVLDGLRDANGVDVRKDLLSRLSDQLLCVNQHSVVPINAEPLHSCKHWIAFPTGDADKLRTTISKLLANEENIAEVQQGEVQQGEVQQGEVALWFAKWGQIFSEGSGLRAILLSAMEIVFSTDRAVLERDLAKGGDVTKSNDPFVQSKDFANFQQQLDAWQADSACFVYYVHTGRIMQPFMDAMLMGRDLSVAPLAARAMQHLILGESRMAAAKLPSYQQIGTPLDVFGAALWLSDSGFRFRAAVIPAASP